MAPASMTRRRALALSAAAGAGAVLARTPAPAFSATRLFSMPARVGRTLRAPCTFDLVGLKGPALETAGLELRTRPAGGRWSPWIPVHAAGDHRPTRDDSGPLASDPIWVDGARELQLRAKGRLAAGARLQFVAVSPLARRAGARAVTRARSAFTLRQAGAPPTFMPRAAWGARAARGRPAFGEVQVAFVHHTVTANEYAQTDVPAILQSIQRYHMDSNGWNDIGYNFLVDRFGGIWEGRAGGIDQPVVGAQAQGWNDDSTGISNIGTFTSVALSPAALEANARLIAWKLSLHGVPTQGAVPLVSGGGSSNRYKAGTVVSFNRIAGHRDADSTTCPGNALYAQLPALRARAAALAPQFAAASGGLALNAAAVAVPYGKQLQLTGGLRRLDGSPVPGAEVVIQKRGSKDWVPVGKAYTAADGNYALQLTWRATGRLRATAVVDGAVLMSAATSFYCIPSVSKITRRVKTSRAAQVRGRVRPADSFQVLIERQSGGTFRRVGTYTVRGRRSAFKAKLPLTRPARYRITPVVTSGSNTFKGASRLLRAFK